MIYTITVKPRSKKSCVEKQPDGSWRVSVHSPAEKGKANEEVVKVLADFFGVPQSRVQIIKGLSSRRKLVSIE